MLYTRSQLWLLLALAGVFLAGLAVREWRAGFPELAARLERFDREEAPEMPPVPMSPAPLSDPRARRQAPRSPGAAGESPVTRPPAASEHVVEPPAADPRPLDLNAASLEQIARLPGIGPALARRIVEERERRGRFDSPDALRGVLGLGPKKLAAVRDLLMVATE